MDWVHSAALSIGQSFLLGVAAWTWATFCAVTIVRVWGHWWGIRVSDRTLAFAAPAAVITGTVAALLIYHLQSFSIFGIHGLEIEQPHLHWIWWGLVALEPVGSAVRFLANRRMWARQAALAERDYVLRPHLTEIMMIAADAVIDWAGESK